MTICAGSGEVKGIVFGTDGSMIETGNFRRLTADEMAGFSPGRRGALAVLAHSAGPKFYGLIPLERERVVGLISSMLGKPGTPFANLHVLSQDDQDLALIADLPASALASAWRAESVSILRALDRAGRATFLGALDAYTRSVEPISPDGVYLTTIGVTPSARRGGLGQMATEYCLALCAEKITQVHVAAGNRAPIALCHKLGFEFLSDAPYALRTMVRAPERALAEE